jgi:hypothetical protein
LWCSEGSVPAFWILDGKGEEIRMLLEKTGSKASIAKIVGVSRTALHHFIRTRKLDAKASTWVKYPASGPILSDRENFA